MRIAAAQTATSAAFQKPVGVTIVNVGVSAAQDLLAYFKDPNKSRGCFNTTVSYLERPKAYKFEPPHALVRCASCSP
eukprot:1156437-Pelagomonas_calceolata.AAC.14